MNHYVVDDNIMTSSANQHYYVVDNIVVDDSRDYGLIEFVIESSEIIMDVLPARTGKTRPGIVEHYLQSLWYAGTEPTRRVLKDPSILLPIRREPKSLIPVYFDITLEGLKKQYEYFILKQDPWD